jgi:hypothetical protein
MPKKTIGSLATKKSGGSTYTANPLTAAVGNLRTQGTQRPGPRVPYNTPRTARRLDTGGYAGMDPPQVKKELKLRYGTGLGKSINKQMVTATASREQTLELVKAGRDQLTAGNKTIGEIATIFKQGQMAQAAAYGIAKARAVQEATGASDSQAAAFAMDMMKMEIQHQWAVEDQENAIAQAEAQATAVAGEQAGMAATGIANSVPSIVSMTTDAYRKTANSVLEKGQEGGSFTSAQVMDTLTASGGPAPGTTEYMIAERTVMNMKLGQNAPDATENALRFVYRGMPGFDEWGAQAIDASLKGVTVAAQDARRSWLESHPDTSYAMAHSGTAPEAAGTPSGSGWAQGPSSNIINAASNVVGSPDSGLNADNTRWQDVWGLFPNLFG